MKLSRSVTLAVFLGFCFCLLAPLANAQVPPPSMPCSGANLVDQKFPTVGPEVTHWRLCSQTVPGNGLEIQFAYFPTSPFAAWLFLSLVTQVSVSVLPY